MSEERRHHSRVSFKVEAELSIEGGQYRAAEICNLSNGGCLLPIKEELTAGTACQLKILMGGASSELSIRVDGEIVRSSGKGVAIKFTRIDPDSLLHLQNIVRYNAPYSENTDKEFQFKRGLF